MERFNLIEAGNEIVRLSTALAAADKERAQWQGAFTMSEKDLDAARAKIASQEASLVGLRVALESASHALEEADRLAPTDKDGEYFQKVQAAIDAALASLPAQGSALLDDVRRKALEEAAKICDEYAERRSRNVYADALVVAGRELAKTIRALSVAGKSLGKEGSS